MPTSTTGTTPQPGTAPGRVAIIGGGLSGLATAAQLHLAAPELDLSLLEAAPRLGGVIHTERVGQFVIDHGADMFATQPSAALDLVERLGATDRLIEPKPTGRGAKIAHRGRLVSIPEGFVLMRATQVMPVLTTPLLSPAAKLRLLAEHFVPIRRGDSDESVGAFVRRRLGQEVLERIVGPLIAGIYTADVEKLSMRATMKPLWEMVGQHGSLTAATVARRRSGQDSVERNSSGARYSQFRSFAGGMIELVDVLAGALPEGTVRTETTAQSLRPLGDGRWELAATGGGGPERFDHVVVATPPRAAASLIRPAAPEAAEQLASIESASTAIVVLGVRREDVQRPADSFGVVVPPKEKRRILAASFASEKFAGRAPADHVLVRVFIGGALQSELLERDDEALIAIAREELGDLIGLVGEPVLTKVVRWNHAMPQYHVGHLERVAAIERAIEPVEGLSLASNALHGVGIAPVIASAGRVAEEIAGRFGAATVARVSDS